MMHDIHDYRKQIEDALEYADHSHSFEDICEMERHGKIQFWPGPNSVIITELLEYPSYRALNFFLAGGNITEIEAMYPLIEKWGRAAGCDRAIATGRKGWERSFLTRKEGFVPKLVVYEKKF